MKKLFLVLFLALALAGFSQTASSPQSFGYNGGTISTSSLDTVSGDVSYYYFRFDRPVNAYSIQAHVKSMITGDSTIAILQGSNFLGNWTAIDTLNIPDSVTTFVAPVRLTGTTAPYAIYRMAIPDTDKWGGVETALKGGQLYFYIYYY